MGLFSEYEKPGYIYNKDDIPASDEQNYPETADHTVNLHMIRLGTREQEIFDNIIATYEANPNGDVTDKIFKSSWVNHGGKWFKVVNEPEYLPHMKVTKIYFVKQTQPHV
jgi:hypothetical protein